MRRATNQCKIDKQCSSISIHALLAESDVKLLLQLMMVPLFLSTLSLRRATRDTLTDDVSTGDFYPRSPCGERRSGHRYTRQHDAISIHALLAESDVIRKPTATGNNKFLSTLSLRRATVTRVASTPTTVISIHALLAESDRGNRRRRNEYVISIHALLAESDARQ